MKRRRKKLLAGVLLVVMFFASAFAGAGHTNVCLAAAEDAIAPANLGEQGYDVIVVGDNSGSVWNQQAARDRALRNIANLAVGSEIRIGGVYFGDNVCKKLSLTSMEDKEGSQKVMDFLNMTEKNESNRGTNIGKALEAAREMLEQQGKYKNQIVVLFSDGINENLAGDPAYKAAADQKTLEQAKLLEKKGIPVYCVYLQKARNDEAYLKNLVNYFNNANSYEAERFKKVTDAEIGQLSEKFAEIFYSMKNDMKYKKVTVDSLGEMNFHVPALGVRKIQIYLENDTEYKVKLGANPKIDEELQMWKDGNSTYISIEDPGEKDWTLTVMGDGKENVRGTIAYYASLAADIKLIGAHDEEGNALRGQSQQMLVNFYDEDGKQVGTDPAAEVTADIWLKNEAGEETHQEISFTAGEEGYESESFKLNEYGTYGYNVSIRYEDFVNLSYKAAEGGIVQGQKPIVHDQNQTFQARGTKSGKEFTFKAQELYSDPDKEEVMIENITQMNKENPVKVTEKNGIVTVTAKKAGDVKFALNIKDASGLSAVVTVEGKVVDVVMVQLIQAAIIIAVLAVLFILVLRKQNKKNTLKRLEEECKKAKDYYAKKGKLDKRFAKLSEQSSETKESLCQVIENLQDTCEDVLAEEQQEEYGVRECLTENYGAAKIAEIEKLEQKIVRESKDLDVCIDFLREEEKKEESASLKKVEEYNKKAEKAFDSLNEKMKAYKEGLEKINEEAEQLSDHYCDILEMLDTEIRCELIVKWKDYIGSKGCKSGRKYLTGSYSLDDVGLLVMGDGPRTVREGLKIDTGIFVYGYEAEDEENHVEGLELRSMRPFRIRNAASGQNKTVTKAVLEKGEEYKLTPEQAGTILLKVN